MWILGPKVRETYPIGEPVVGREGGLESKK